MRKLPPETFSGQACGPVMEIESYNVTEWCPTPDGSGQPEQVWLQVNLKDVPIPMALRLKSMDAVDTLIEALTRHRLNVWPQTVT